MSKKNGFFAAPNLDEEESIIRPNEEADNKKYTGLGSGKKETPKSGFFVSDLDGNPMGRSEHSMQQALMLCGCLMAAFPRYLTL